MSRARVKFKAAGVFQRGLGLATALFVITVMALLASLIFQLIRSNTQSTQEQIQLVRAFYAAESGVQFGLNKVFPPGPPAAVCAAGPTTYNLAVDGLNQCTAAVVCSSVTVDSIDYYTITSTGTCGDVSRTIQVRAQ
jgi:MSHA biogenesis protein MshP